MQCAIRHHTACLALGFALLLAPLVGAQEAVIGHAHALLGTVQVLRGSTHPPVAVGLARPPAP